MKIRQLKQITAEKINQILSTSSLNAVENYIINKEADHDL
jgi:hypothetical protein